MTFEVNKPWHKETSWGIFLSVAFLWLRINHDKNQSEKENLSREAVKPGTLLEARENARDQVVFGLSLVSDW